MAMLDRTKRPPVTSFAYRPMPPCTVTTLDNGVRLHTVNVGDVPVNRITVISGLGREEAQPIAGIAAAQFLSSLISEGTSNMSGEEIARHVDYHGAFLFNGIDNHHQTLSLVSLNSDTKVLAPLLTDIFRNAAIPEDAFVAMRTQASQRYLVESGKPSVRASRELNRLITGEGHPLSISPDEKAIMSTDVSEVRRLHTIMRDRASVDVYIGGCLDDSIINTVTELCASLRGNAPTEPLAPLIVPERAAAAGTYTIDMAQSLQTAIAIGIPAIPREHPDYIKLRLTVMALGGYFGSRLMTSIREEKGLTYGIGASLLGAPDGAVINISAQSPAGSGEMVVSEIISELRRLASERMGVGELERLRQYAFTQLMAGLDSPFAITDYYTNMLLSGTPTNYFHSQFTAIDTLTAETIMEMSKKYLQPDKMRIVTAGPN